MAPPSAAAVLPVNILFVIVRSAPCQSNAYCSTIAITRVVAISTDGGVVPKDAVIYCCRSPSEVLDGATFVIRHIVDEAAIVDGKNHVIHV